MSSRVKALLAQVQDQERRLEEVEDDNDRLLGELEEVLKRLSELERWRLHLGSISDRQRKGPRDSEADEGKTDRPFRKRFF